MAKKSNYDRAAWFYEQTAHIYSLGGIRRSKLFQTNHFSSGDKVLFLGVGSGEDAVAAARTGAEVTCIDLSKQMLERLEKRLERENLKANMICADVAEQHQYESFDFVAANYFLNCFREEGMKTMLSRGVRLLKPGGKFLIADVATARGNIASRVFNVLYLKSAMLAFWAMGLVPLHKNYDYCKYFSEVDLETEQIELVRFGGIGPVVFQSIIARKKHPTGAPA